jgi:hypothetical protein
MEGRMKRLIVVAMLLSPALALAQSPIDGTWKIDVASVKFPEKPDKYLLQDGRWTCSTCVPPIEVAADGSNQKVEGSKYLDTMAVKVLDDHRVQFTAKKDGKTVQESTNTVSPDGATLTVEFTFYPPSGQPGKGAFTSRRVAKGPTGAHAISGSWRTDKAGQFSENALTITFKSTADGLTMSQPTGESYDAKFDGKDYPIKGDRGGSTVSVKRIDDRTVEETTKRDGKVVGVSRMTVAADGKSMDMTYDDKERGTTMSYVAKKQ